MGHILALARAAEPIVAETDGKAIGAIAMTCHGVIAAGASTPDSLVGTSWRLRRLHFPTTPATAS
jgi:hypothetical protein